MSPLNHIFYSPLLPTTGLQVNTSSKPSESYQYYRSPCHHVPTSLILYYYLLQVYRSTRRQTLRTISSLQVTMSPPRHIPCSLLLPTTGQHVVKTSEAYHYYRSPCHHLIIYFILHYYLLQVYRSTRRQNPQNHTSTTGHHVTTSPYLLSSTTTYYRSTGKHIVKTLRFILYYRSTCPHLAIYLILYYYLP